MLAVTIVLDILCAGFGDRQGIVTRLHSNKIPMLRHGTPQHMLQYAQAQQYRTLRRFVKVAAKNSWTNWTLSAGSLAGFRCYGAMNAWDDDIDIVVGDCSALHDLFEQGIAGGPSYPPWQGVFVQSQNVLLYKHEWPSGYFFKLKLPNTTIRQKRLGGIDISCLGHDPNLAEQKAQRDSHLLQTVGRTVSFGPVQAVRVPPVAAMKAYLKSRGYLLC